MTEGMKNNLEKMKSNHGIHIRGPYQNTTAYIATFIDAPEYEAMVDFLIANYSANAQEQNGKYKSAVKRIAAWQEACPREETLPNVRYALNKIEDIVKEALK